MDHARVGKLVSGVDGRAFLQNLPKRVPVSANPQEGSSI